jgi:hypothetical protein
MTRLTLYGALALAALLSWPRVTHAQAAGDVAMPGFDKADRRSRVLLGTIRCAQGVSMARARGEFGSIDSLGRNGQCIRVDGRAIGIFMDVDTQFVATTRFTAVDLAAHTRYTAPLDTVAVLAVARAEYAAQMRGAPSFLELKRPYSPIAFRFDGDSIEVWLIPVTLVRGQPFTLGGERGYVYAPDGRTLAREIDASADYRPIAVPDTGAVNIVSQSTSLPSLSELVLANGLNSIGRNVAIVWTRGTSALAGRGEQAVWIHLARTP